MRAGLLDRTIVLQRKTMSYSSTGEPVEMWSNIATRRAAIDPVTGDERNAAQQWIAREQTKFTVRWSVEIVDLSPLDRVIFPADDASTSPTPSRSIYDIISAEIQGRNEQFVILAARRVG